MTNVAHLMQAPHLMQAVVAETPAGPLRLKQVPTPHPGPGDMLVRVVASGVNPLDAKILAGAADHARQALPITRVRRCPPSSESTWRASWWRQAEIRRSFKQATRFMAWPVASAATPGR